LGWRCRALRWRRSVSFTSTCWPASVEHLQTTCKATQCRVDVHCVISGCGLYIPCYFHFHFVFVFEKIANCSPSPRPTTVRNGFRLHGSADFGPCSASRVGSGAALPNEAPGRDNNFAYQPPEIVQRKAYVAWRSRKNNGLPNARPFEPSVSVQIVPTQTTSEHLARWPRERAHQ
jgi:hypothetical protein